MLPHFTTTSWTMIAGAANTSSTSSQESLAALCQRYWEPLYAYARHQGRSHEDAQDLTQAFFAHFIAHNLPRVATPTLGRFRSFLLTSMRNFMHTEYRSATTLKRGGTVPALSFDEALHEVTDESEATAIAAYDRQWAHTVIDHALAEVAAQQTELGNAERFIALRPMLLDPSAASALKDEVLSQLGLSDTALRACLSRLRAAFREAVKREVAISVADPAEVEAEISYLLQVLRS